jgi:hypothetical protein
VSGGNREGIIGERCVLPGLSLRCSALEPNIHKYHIVIPVAQQLKSLAAMELFVRAGLKNQCQNQLSR